ncbi:hypothetical protein L2E82_44825 [Cichorium intybus]|uniref:Uncharacterized protein n=1 Tax=Cichorium intybus TaxID=13427 RepID=A0ACB8ZR70_CICIN|nr:hypothetical protein L2E82_44825 [Cichorium intybus]
MKAISPPEEVSALISRNSLCSIEVNVCQTCGDVGFTNAFVYCVKCLEFVIHRYCLNVIPKSFTEHVIWYCESCKPTVQKKVTSPEVESSSPQKNESKKNIDTIWRKRSRDGENCIQKQHKKKEKKERDIASLIAESNEVICHYLPEENNVSQLPNIENNIQDNYYRHGQPIIDPVWRGSFTVHGKDRDDLFEGLVGHLSNKACGKVCEEANLMPSLLHLEMQSKTLLWPKSFQHCEPSDDHIALYFFPGDPINERAFDELVLDMMEGSLAMRATVKNADLLIFTSATLPTLFRSESLMTR